jgi:hypothetical protein
MLMAVRAYRNDHGVLPASGSDLVPAYFAEAPIDPWSGKPIVYDRNKRMVYSIGSDRTDNGGDQHSADELDPWRTMRDQVLPITF